jgi:hypothetical protein
MLTREMPQSSHLLCACGDNRYPKHTAENRRSSQIPSQRLKFYYQALHLSRCRSVSNNQTRIVSQKSLLPDNHATMPYAKPSTKEKKKKIHAPNRSAFMLCISWFFDRQWRTRSASKVGCADHQFRNDGWYAVRRSLHRGLGMLRER